MNICMNERMVLQLGRQRTWQGNPLVASPPHHQKSYRTYMTSGTFTPLLSLTRTHKSLMYIAWKFMFAIYQRYQYLIFLMYHISTSYFYTDFSHFLFTAHLKTMPLYALGRFIGTLEISWKTMVRIIANVWFSLLSCCCYYCCYNYY